MIKESLWTGFEQKTLQSGLDKGDPATSKWRLTKLKTGFQRGKFLKVIQNSRAVPWILHTGSSGMQKCCPDKHSGQISSSRTWQSLKSKHRLVKVENVNHLHSRFSLQRSKQANSSVVVKTPTVELSRHSPDWKHWADQPIKVQILYIRYKI